MPVAPLRLVSKSQNGVGAFILQCKRLDFHYCDWAGSNKGMKCVFLPSLPPATLRMEESEKKKNKQMEGKKINKEILTQMAAPPRG